MRQSILILRARGNSAGCLQLCLLVPLILASPAAQAAEPSRDPFQRDARLQKTVTIRVSRMPVADLLQRLERELGVPLTAEGDDVADQKLALFTHGEPVTAAEIMSAIAGLFNAECPPRGFRWERYGQAPRFRYALVRDVASRRWEAERAAAAEARLPEVLRRRFAELGTGATATKGAVRPEGAGTEELPSRRKLLPLLTDEQFTRLCADRYLSLRPADWTAGQKALYSQLVQELIADYARREPDLTRETLARYKSPADYPHPQMEVLIRGEAPHYIIEIGVDGPPPMGELRESGVAEDTSALEEMTKPGPALPVLDPDPRLALPPRPPAPGGNVRADNTYVPWLMGEILADIAARARINLIADDYTRLWPDLARIGAPRPLSAWLSLIRDSYHFNVTRDGKFLRLRNRAWYLDHTREVPSRVVARWRQMLRGTNADRLDVLVEIAQRMPVRFYGRLTWDRLRILENDPELTATSRQEGSRTVSSFFGVVANRHLELLLYSRMPAARQREVFGEGLTITWPDIPADLQQLYRRVASKIQEQDPEAFRSFRIFMRYQGDRLQIDREWPTRSIRDPMELILPAEPADDLRALVGRPLPDLDIEPASGKTALLRPRGPVLLYVTPAWPRPIVARQESFEELRTLESLDSARVQILGTEATAAELRDWWKERGLAVPPLALRPASAQRLGVHHLPLAIVAERSGRITWVKEGFTAGDEAEWRRQLERAGR